MTTHNHPLEEVRQAVKKQILEFIVNNDLAGAKQFINTFLKDPLAYSKLRLAFCGLPQELNTAANWDLKHAIERYMLSALCITGNNAAIHELGMLYAGYDGDEMDAMLIPEQNITTALTLFNLAGTYQSCLEIIYICTEGHEGKHYLDQLFPQECIDQMIKTNLIRAINLFDQRNDQPDRADFSFTLDRLPSEILNDPEIAQHLTKFLKIHQ